MNLNQVAVPVTDIERSIVFYTDLGLKLIVEAPHYARFECADGDSTFSIHLADVAFTNGTYIYFEDETLDDWVKHLQLKGFAFHELPRDKQYLWREARLKDPDGNNLILYYAGKNRKFPPWRVDQ
jgi:catechol 2,3-dioxygenase-like lactoylglutathione lyase family enzyme